MTQDPKLRATARKLAQLCIVDGKPSADAVKGTLESLRALPPSRRRELLVQFERAMTLELARYEATVEFAGALSSQALSELAATLKTLRGHPVSLKLKETPELIAGVRIRIEDDIFDASLRSRLNTLKARLA